VAAEKWDSGGVSLRRSHPDVALVTTAEEQRDAAIDARQRGYLKAMGIRTVSFVLGVTLPVPIWARLLIVGIGMLLPLAAVTGANAPAALEKRDLALLPHEVETPAALTAPAGEQQVVIDGVTVVRDGSDPARPAGAAAEDWRARRQAPERAVLDGEVVRSNVEKR
jgi:hypothetical protein